MKWYKPIFLPRLQFINKAFNNLILKILLFPLFILILIIIKFFDPFFITLFEWINFYENKETRFSFFDKYLFVPATVISILLYTVGIMIFGIWYFLFTLSLFTNTMGFFGTLIFVYIPQIPLLFSPIIILFRDKVIFFQLLNILLIYFLFGVQKFLIYPTGSKWSGLQYLNHSPWIYLCGAVSTYVIEYFIVGVIGGVSNHSSLIWFLAYLGLSLMILSGISVIIWSRKKKQMDFVPQIKLYKPSWLLVVSIYILIKSFNPDIIPSAVPSLDIILILVLVKRIMIRIFNKIKWKHDKREILIAAENIFKDQGGGV